MSYAGLTHIGKSTQPNLARISMRVIIAIAIVQVVASHVNSGWKRRPEFGIKHLEKKVESITALQSERRQLFKIRGGSFDTKEEDDEEDTDAEEIEEESEEDDEDDDESPLLPSTLDPVTIRVKTNMGNSLLDQSFDFMVVQTRNIASIKQSISRQLPGRPPASILSVLFHGQQITDEETLIHELVLEEAEEEKDEEDTQNNDDDTEEKVTLTLVVDIVPPLDSKLSTSELASKMQDVSTSELLDSYVLTESALLYTDELIDEEVKNEQHRIEEKDEDDEYDDEEEKDGLDLNPVSSPRRSNISFQLRQNAGKLRERMETNLFSEVIETLLQDPAPSAIEEDLAPEERGHRIRTSNVRSNNAGVAVSLRQAIQHNLNIHWADTFRNFFLFLFFGWFGGRTSISRNLLLLGAPFCFIVQARPVKLFWKQLLYTVLYHPPSILLSLLPAPQQAILNLNIETSMQSIYGSDVNIDEYCKDLPYVGDNDYLEDLSESNDEYDLDDDEYDM